MRSGSLGFFAISVLAYAIILAMLGSMLRIKFVKSESRVPTLLGKRSYTDRSQLDVASIHIQFDKGPLLCH